MEGRVQLRCAECEKTRECAGEIPEEYTACFAHLVKEDGFVPRPGVGESFICGDCLAKNYSGHETVDDEEKVQGRRNPKKA